MRWPKCLLDYLRKWFHVSVKSHLKIEWSKMKPGFEPATSRTDREANEMTIGNGKCTVQRQSSKCKWDRFQVGVKVGDTRVVRKARNSISAERDESDAMQPIAVEANDESNLVVFIKPQRTSLNHFTQIIWNNNKGWIRRDATDRDGTLEPMRLEAKTRVTIQRTSLETFHKDGISRRSEPKETET